MKKTVAITAALAASAFAQASIVPNTFSPNHYQCKGEGVEVTVEVGRFPGPGHLPGYILRVKEAAGEPVVAHDSSLTVENTVFGEILSAALEFVPDYRSRYASIVIPRINMDAQMEKVDFKTLYVDTQKMTTFAGPQHVRGLVDRSKPTPLNCVASYVSLPHPSR